MRMGEHMEPVTELVNDLTNGSAEEALKLLSLVVLEYMLSVDCTEFNVSAGALNINVSVSED
jgi:hypothetical protein